MIEDQNSDLFVFLFKIFNIKWNYSYSVKINLELSFKDKNLKSFKEIIIYLFLINQTPLFGSYTRLTWLQFLHISYLSLQSSTKKGIKQHQPVKNNNIHAQIQTVKPIFNLTID